VARRRARAPRGARLAAPALLCALLAGGAARGLTAQVGPLRGYALNVAGASASSAFGPGGFSDFQRLRLMLSPSLGPLRFEAAYEHLLLYQAHPGAGIGALAPGAATASGDWADLDWTLAQGAHAQWRHRLDRLDLALPAGRLEARVGRQAISWATTLLLTPADPFAPFDPSDPFREYRSGVDAIRLQYFPSPFGQLDLVARPERGLDGRTVTAAARGRVTVASWDLSAWAGVVHGEAAAAAGVTGTGAGAALRLEAEVRRDAAGAAVVRSAVGADRRWSVLGRDLYVVLEYQHDGFGAAGPGALASVLLSAPYRRGEMQVLGRDVAAGELTYQLHPLLSGELLALWDLRDGSALFAPAASLSASNNVTVRASAFLPVGRGGSRTVLASEFGGVPRFGYLAVSLFF
jgi:hypothetical protein